MSRAFTSFHVADHLLTDADRRYYLEAVIEDAPLDLVELTASQRGDFYLDVLRVLLDSYQRT